MSVRRGGRHVLAVVALAATMVGVAATPGATSGPAERAGAAAGDCPFVSALCLFDETGYNGTRFTVSSTTPGGTCVSLVAHGFGGQARSVLNASTSAAALFANDGCVGGPYQVAGGSGIADLGSFRANSVWVR
ncbi:peptidase inhibitor family I36 protein [Polymorphospora rubra]|uniref:peptidase inhibitor family I36 protein n=1 Tax=Polymorphospora rubra TaxID=338584 RepID=UPI001BB3AC57|nr:peptidase inhibitor family I36 protein [Polymorphospora rubra]